MVSLLCLVPAEQKISQAGSAYVGTCSDGNTAVFIQLGWCPLGNVVNVVNPRFWYEA